MMLARLHRERVIAICYCDLNEDVWNFVSQVELNEIVA